MNGKTSLLVMLGFDSEKLPRAARFDAAQESTVAKAASLMGLRVAVAKTDPAIELARKLPEGKLYASGKGTAPRVKKGMYDQLAASVEFRPQELNNNSTGDAAADEAIQAAAPLWQTIKVGSLVLAFDATDPKLPCWCAAVVQSVAKDNETLSVRWRDYPGWKPFTVKRSTVGLLLPAKS